MARSARATVNRQNVSVGGLHLPSGLKLVVPPELEKAASAWASAGQTGFYVAVDGRGSALWPRALPLLSAA